MGAPKGNDNAKGPHKSYSKTGRGKNKLIRRPSSSSRAAKNAGFKKTKYKNIWIG